MSKYKIVYTKQALKEKKHLQAAGLDKKIGSLLEIISVNPFENYPPYEKLIGDLSGLYSRRINRQHRLVYMVYEQERTVKVVSLWTHYDNIR